MRVWSDAIQSRGATRSRYRHQPGLALSSREEAPGVLLGLRGGLGRFVEKSAVNGEREPPIGSGALPKG